MSALHPSPAARSWPLWFCLLLTLSPLFGSPDDERIARLQEDLKTYETVIANNKSESERTRLQAKADRTKEELSVLRERLEIEKRQKALVDQQPSHAIDRLRERLRALDINSEEAEKRIQQSITQRRAVAAERDEIEARLAQAKTADGAKPADLTDLEEQLVNRNELLRSFSLQREAAELKLELAREADRLREYVKNWDASSRPNLRMIFEAFAKTRENAKSGDKLDQLSATVSNNLRVASLNLDLAEQKMTKFDEELALLEKQTGFFRTDPAVAKLLAVQKAQKRILSERIPALVSQTESLRAAEAAIRSKQELLRMENEAGDEHYRELRAGYVKRLRWPAAALSAVLAAYLLLHYGLLRLFYRKESLLLARRLSRYASLVAAAGVIAGFLFDDLSMIAATLGIVSAALVIALQDVCTSIAGWFIIMTGGKFRIGDRLEIEESRGDVIDIQLLRTTLVEVANWMDSDHPTGRVLVIPNNFIFKGKVFNYSHQHPFIWGKLEILVTYATPIAEATSVFHRILAEETIEEFAAAQQAAEVFRKRYGVDDAVYQPRINTRIGDSGVFLDLIYVAHYRRTTAARNRICRRIIAELEKNPRIQLAYPTSVQYHANSSDSAPSAIMGSETDTGSRPPFGYPTANFPLRPPILPGN